MERIKARLKENITEEQFINATFGDFKDSSDYGIYDIEKMKTEDLRGTKDYNGNVYISIISIDRDTKFRYGYEKKNVNIWDYELIKE